MTKSRTESLGLRLQLTGQKWFTRSFSGDYKMTNDSCVRKLFLGIEEAITESVVHESTETQSMSVEDGKSMAMANEFYKKQCHV